MSGNQPRHHLESSHSPAQIRRRLERGPRQEYLRDFVYGAIDGVVTTFAVVAGVAGAQLGEGIVVVLGVANLLADGASMAASNYLGTRTEEQSRELARRREERHIASFPEGEREEVRQIYAAKGFAGEVLEDVVDVITSDRERWIDTMMTEELGLPLTGRSPMKAAIATFLAFIAAGLLPLISYLLALLPGVGITDPFVWSIALTGAGFFLIGAAKSSFVEEAWWRAGLETLAIGGLAAILAYVAGALLRGLV